MKSFCDSRGSLDIPPTDASLKLNSFFMSRVKKKLAALAVLFTLEFLSLGLCTNGSFSWSNQYILAATQTDATTVKLGSPAETDDVFVFGSYGEPTPRSGIFLTAKQSLGMSARSFFASPFFCRIILAPKVSRYISKSVLNL
jgi:hypothetical protein